MVTAKELADIRDALTRARLTTYVHAAHGNARRGLALYQWNAGTAAALWPVLHVNEIVLRNAVARVLETVYGPSWFTNPTFVKSLPQHECATFERERNKTVRKVLQRKKTAATSGDVVAAQTYHFWVSLLTARYDNRLWNTHLSAAFPHLPTRVTRDVIYTRADAIRRFRNRIAHHEPILIFQLPAIYRSLVQLIAWTCPTTSAWVCASWPESKIIRARP